MGCTFNRGSTTQEEALQHLEGFLGFNKHSSESIDFQLRKLSSNDRLNQSQLIDFLNSLNLISWDTRKQIMAFYNAFQAEPSKYQLKPLLIMGILLGNSPSHIKAKLIFEAFDSENSKSISTNTIMEILDLILSISLDTLPKLSEIQSYQSSLINEYITCLNRYRLFAKIKMARLLVPFNFELTDSVTKDQFISNCTKEEPAAQLFSPEGVRTFILAVSKHPMKNEEI